MATTNTLAIANFTSVYTSPLTDQESADLLEWFIKDVADSMPDGLTLNQQRQWKLDQANAEIVRHIRWKANRNKWRARQALREEEDRQAEEEGQF